jgi:hypothetical protein
MGKGIEYHHMETLELIYHGEIVTELQKIGTIWRARKWAHGDQPCGRGEGPEAEIALRRAHECHEFWLAAALRSIELGA